MWHGHSKAKTKYVSRGKNHPSKNTPYFCFLLKLRLASITVSNCGLVHLGRVILLSEFHHGLIIRIA